MDAPRCAPFSGMVAVLLACAPSFALTPRMQELKDISVGLGEQLPTGFVGIGARGMAMGGAQLAAVGDGSALFWNPAALTRIRRIELLAGLTHNQPERKSDVGFDALNSTGASRTVTALNATILTLPYPTYRGALTFSFGAARPNDYGYRAQRDGLVGLDGQAYWQEDRVRQNGGLWQYAMGMAAEVSPNVSLGASLVWYHGSVNVTRNLSLLQQIGVLPDSLTGSYRQNNSIDGVMMTFSTLVQLPLGFHLGIVAVPPVTYDMEGTWGDEYVEARGTNVFYYDYPSVEPRLHYKIESPWQLGLGAAWATYALSLSADVWYVDWRQASFEGSPYGTDSGINTDTFFEDRYDQVLRWHVGAEVLVPWIATYLRAGHYVNPDPFRGPMLDTGEPLSYVTTGSYFTAGAGWLIEQVFTLDVAFVAGEDRYRTGEVTEKRSARRVFLSLAFRM